MSEYREDDHIKQLQRELKAARDFPKNTTPASRHLELMADALAVGDGYSMFQDDPKHCAITMYAVLIGFYNRQVSSTSLDTLMEIRKLASGPGDRRLVIDKIFGISTEAIRALDPPRPTSSLSRPANGGAA